MYDRFFAFGCSHTNYRWPTWADIIATDLGIPYYNLGVAGIGNVGIMHKIVAADLKYTFTDNDLIIIMWSHWAREDRYLGNCWEAHGSVFNNPFYDKKFIKKYWSNANDIIKNSTAIISTNKMYKEKIQFQCHIMEPAEAEDDQPGKMKKHEQKLIDFYSPYIPKDHILDDYPGYNFDGHPTVTGHLRFVTDHMYPNIGLKIKPETIGLYRKVEGQMSRVRKESEIPEFQRPSNAIIDEEL